MARRLLIAEPIIPLMTSKRQYDIVVLSATGYTGTLVVKHLQQHAPKKVRWAICGRSKQRLTALQDKLCLPSQVGLLTADAHNDDELDLVCRSTRVVISCIGPYISHGHATVSACVRNGTHYVDFSGEGPFLHWIVDTHDEAAKANGVLILPSSGFASAPPDMGNFAVQEYAAANGLDLTSVTGNLSTNATQAGRGTWETVAALLPVLSPSYLDTFALVPEAGRSDRRPTVMQFPTYCKVIGRYSSPNLAGLGDATIVHRSNYLRGHDVPYTGAFSFGLFLAVVSTVVYYFTLVLVYLPWVRRVLSKVLVFVIPYIAGDHTDGPSDQELATLTSRFDFVGTTKQGKDIVCRLDFGKAPYVVTAWTAAEAALSIVGGEELSGKGGVMTTASALGSVLMRRLKATGMKFDIRHS